MNVKNYVPRRPKYLFNVAPKDDKDTTVLKLKKANSQYKIKQVTFHSEATMPDSARVRGEHKNITPRGSRLL